MQNKSKGDLSFMFVEFSWFNRPARLLSHFFFSIFLFHKDFSVGIWECYLHFSFLFRVVPASKSWRETDNIKKKEKRNAIITCVHRTKKCLTAKVTLRNHPLLRIKHLWRLLLELSVIINGGGITFLVISAAIIQTKSRWMSLFKIQRQQVSVFVSVSASTSIVFHF